MEWEKIFDEAYESKEYQDQLDEQQRRIRNADWEAKLSDYNANPQMHEEVSEAILHEFLQWLKGNFTLQQKDYDSMAESYEYTEDYLNFCKGQLILSADSLRDIASRAGYKSTISHYSPYINNNGWVTIAATMQRKVGDRFTVDLRFSCKHHDEEATEPLIEMDKRRNL